MSAGLEEEREFLLRSIRDLDAEFAAGDIDEHDYRSLRDDYTARAAEVLRRVESTPSPVAVRSRRKAPTSRAKVAAGVALLALISGGAGYAVASSSGERLAGDEASGDIVQGTTDRITKAQVLVSEGRILEAVKVYDELLAEDPENPVALAQRGWLLSRVDASLVDSGLAGIDRAIAVDPTYADAYFYKGMTLLLGKDDPQLALAAFEQGLANNPAPDVRSGLEQGRQRAQTALDAAAASATSTP